MGLDRVLHCELRQSVEAYLGFVLLGIISGNFPVIEISFSEALLAIGMVVQPGGLGSMQVTDTDAHADKRIPGFQVRDYGPMGYLSGVQ